MTEPELQPLLARLIAEWENECVEFKDANDNFSTSDIGKYFSALSNEANLRGRSAALRHQGLVEGRRPKLHVASHIAAATETEAEYIHHRAFDDAYYRDLILQYLKKFGSAKRAKFNRLLEEKLSDLLTARQKQKKIHNLLQHLRREGKVKVAGYGPGSIWSLPSE